MRAGRSRLDGKKKLTSISVGDETRRLVRELQNDLSYSELGGWNGYWSADDVISAAVKAYRKLRSEKAIGSRRHEPIDNETSAGFSRPPESPDLKAIAIDSDDPDDQGAE